MTQTRDRASKAGNTDAAGRTIHQVDKELSRPQKVLTVGKGLIELDMRQGAIIGTALVLCLLPYQVLSLPFLQTVLVGVPLVAFACTLALWKPHGKYLESWVYNFILATVNPKKMVYRRQPERGGNISTSGEGRGRKRASVKDAIQTRLPQERIVDDMIRRSDEVWAMVLEATPTDVSFHDPRQAEQLRRDLSEAENQLDFPRQELTVLRRSSLTAYAASVERRAADRSASSEALSHFVGQHKQFLLNFADNRDTRDRRTFIVIPYDATFERHREAARGYGTNVGRVASLTSKVSRTFGPLLSASRKAAKLQRDAETAHDQLAERAKAARRAYASAGVQLRLLEGGELYRTVKDNLSYDADAHAIPEGAPNPRTFTPITLDEGVYARLSERRFDKALEGSQQARANAAPAMGVGKLSAMEPTAADKTAPGLVEIAYDHLRIDQSYHTTLFVTVLPPRPFSGIFDELLTTVSGRIRISKHIRPKDAAEIENTLSARIQELQDTEDDSELGSAKNQKERQIALESAEHAHDRLVNDEERYFELSTYIHLEADSKSELDAMVSTVKRTLARWHAEATRAYLEMWQGYISSCCFADDRLQARYTASGVMTDALSCLHTFGSTQIRHPGGVLVGEKLSGDDTSPPVPASKNGSRASGSLGQRPGDGHVIVNSRKLENPHWLITGIPGSGKTHAGKSIISREFMNGKRVRGIDPVGNSGYRYVTEALGGQYVLIGPGSPHHFNPCQITKNYANLQLLEAALQMEEGPARERAIERAYAERLAGKKRFLNDLVSTMCSNPDGSGSLTTSQQGLVEMLWDKAYDHYEITDDPETHSFTPPTFTTFFHFLRESLDHYPELNEIRRKLSSWESGALKDLFAHQGNIDLSNDWLFFQLGLADKKREQAAVTSAVLDFLNGDISNRSTRDVMPVDELWNPLSYEGARSYMEEFWRTARARRTQMMGISHSLTEFKESREGKSVLDLSTVHLLMRQDQQEVINEMKRYYSLDERNAEDLKQLHPGVGYLRIGGNQIRVYVACSEEEMEIFDTSDTEEEDFEPEEIGDYMESCTVLDSAAYHEESGPAGESPQHYPQPDEAEPDEPAPQPAAGHPFEGEPDADPACVHTGLSESGYEDPEPDDQGGPQPQHDPEPSPARAAPRVVAVAGPEAPIAAFEAAGLLATSAARRGRKVLLVDGEGRLTERLRAAGAPLLRPDAALQDDAARFAAECVIQEPTTTLRVLPCPEATSEGASALIDWASGSYDAVVAAASARTAYGRDWLLAADRVAVSSTRSRTLNSAVASAERLRERNGTVLAPMGRLKTAEEHQARQTAQLPPATTEAIARARDGSTFAFLEDEEVRAAFSRLLGKLLTAEAPDSQPEKTATDTTSRTANEKESSR